MVPGQVWHITHRCHKKEFLLRFARDRRRWVDWQRLETSGIQKLRLSGVCFKNIFCHRQDRRLLDVIMEGNEKHAAFLGHSDRLKNGHQRQKPR
jgi:hypothetical protein